MSRVTDGLQCSIHRFRVKFQIHSFRIVLSGTVLTYAKPHPKISRENFTERGGRLLLVGEPDQFTVSGFFLTKRSSRLTTLDAAFSVSFDTRYLNRTVLYTATTVTARSGTILLETPTETQLSGGGGPGSHPVAVETGNVIAVGDRTFLRDSRFTVADNEGMLQYVTEFLARGETPEEPVKEPEPANRTTG